MNPLRQFVRSHFLPVICASALGAALPACVGMTESAAPAGVSEISNSAPEKTNANEPASPSANAQRPSATTSTLPTAGSATPQAADPVVDPVTGKKAPPAHTACASKDSTPASEDDVSSALGSSSTGNKARSAQLSERHRGLNKSALLNHSDQLTVGVPFAQAAHMQAPHIQAAHILPTPGQIPNIIIDSDNDGWSDAPLNERRKLVLDKIKVNETDDYYDDDVYVIADDVRFPNDNLDDYWNNLDDGDSRAPHIVIATRVRPFASTAPLALVRFEGWEDDYEVFNEWTVDDLLFQYSIDLGAYNDGAALYFHHNGDSNYEVWLHVEIEYFADPTPTADADSDDDGIKDSLEAKIAVEQGGITDPTRKDLLVEVDWMPGHEMRSETKRLVATQMYRHGMQMHIERSEEIPHDSCVSVPDAKDIYARYFTRRAYGAYRYVVMSNDIWNKASGVSWGDIVLIDDSTWWINNRVLSQAGTFIHEIGHTLSLTNDMYSKIDTIAWLSYESAMNYTFQPWLVDYASKGAGGNASSQNDWKNVKASWSLQWSFALVNSNEMGSCK